MLVVIDTDIVNKLSCRTDCGKFYALLREHHVRVTAPETVAEEVLATSNSQVRAELSRTLIELLRDSPLLAPLPHQIEWGVQRFLSGEAAFKPFAAFRPDGVKALLREALTLSDTLLTLVRGKRDEAVRHWDSMHAGGRPSLQSVLKEGVPMPEAGDWMVSILDSEFAHDIVLDALANPAERQRLHPRVAEYIEWNPICRCFLEQLLLAIRRHGIEHRTASSRKGPKWADYYISAFVGIADRFVTDDARLQSALKQHRELRVAVNWELRFLDEFLEELGDSRISSHSNSGLETWPAVEHKTT